MKVLLIDDHPLILTALQTVIESLGTDTVVMTAGGASEAREALKLDSDFDLVLLDLHLGDADGFDVLSEFRSAYPALPVVVVSASDRPSDVIRAIDAGAMGFVPKRSDHDTLCEALNMVMSGGIYVPPMVLGLDANQPATDGHTAPGALQTVFDTSLDDTLSKPTKLADLGLTPRQTEVLALLLKGNPNKLIARELNLSVETVKDHVAAVLRALGVSSRTQAVLAVSQMSSRRTIPGGLSTFLNSFR
jgi:DNA-binding NarL/FixJ family response regulator